MLTQLNVHVKGCGEWYYCYTHTHTHTHTHTQERYYL